MQSHDELLKGGVSSTLANPIDGSFQEWHEAALKADVSCTAMSFPSQKSLIGTFKSNNILHQELHLITQQASDVFSLLKPMIKIGAHTSNQKSLSISQWKKLKSNWPRNKGCQTYNLTWKVQLLVAQR